MEIDLIPQPKKLAINNGSFLIPRSGIIGIQDARLFKVADRLKRILPGHRIVAATNGGRYSMIITLNGKLPEDGYNLFVGRDGIRLEAVSEAAAFYGIQTLLQIAGQSPKGKFPCLSINDWPDFPVRGIYYDVTRGRVPKLERLMEQIDTLARYKINHFQIYIEHAFRFRGHPDIGKGADPLTAEDILKLDAYCRERYIEFVPSLASFGHLQTVLKHKQYSHLCEDWGKGKYLHPEIDKITWWMKSTPGSLSPANPGTYKFLDSLFAEFLPLFSSEKFNVCCDETFDMGLGQTYGLCKKQGKGPVYLGHVLKLKGLAAKYGKKIMFWGDMIRSHPELIAKIPKDITVLDWKYEEDHDFDSIKDFKRSGSPFYGCPGTSTWNTLFPRTSKAMINIHGFAEAGRKHGAAGLLTTDWGDGGHYNFMENSWHAYLFTADQAWNTKADMRDFTGRFCRLFLCVDAGDLPQAVDLLGNIVQHHEKGEANSTIWYHVFFGKPGDPIFEDKMRDCIFARNGLMIKRKMKLDASLAESTIPKLRQIRGVFAKYAGAKGVDPHGILPYWVFCADMVLHAAEKLRTLGPGGRDTIQKRRMLKRDMTALLKRFEKLWFARNRRSEIRTTIKRYRKVLDDL